MPTGLKKDQMTPRERLDAILQGKPYDRIPCSVNVGNQAAKLLGISSSDYVKSADRQVEGILASYKEYGVEFLGPHANILATIGLKYVYPEDSTPYPEEPLVKNYADLERLEIPDFRKATELQVFWETLEKVTEKIGDEVPISIGMSGPFSASAQLRGIEVFMRDLYQNPEFAHKILSFILECTASFVKEVGKYNVKFGIFDPTSSSCLISPKQYRQFSLPYQTELVAVMKNAGDDYPMLHICGNTTKIWKDMAATGAGILSLDNIIDLEAAKKEVGDRVVLMGNVRPTDTMLFGTTKDVEENVKECLIKAADSPKGFLLALGCGMPLNTPPENIHALVEANKKYGQIAGESPLNLFN